MPALSVSAGRQRGNSAESEHSLLLFRYNTLGRKKKRGTMGKKIERKKDEEGVAFPSDNGGGHKTLIRVCGRARV